LLYEAHILLIQMRGVKDLIVLFQHLSSRTKRHAQRVVVPGKESFKVFFELFEAQNVFARHDISLLVGAVEQEKILRYPVAVNWLASALASVVTTTTAATTTDTAGR